MYMPRLIRFGCNYLEMVNKMYALKGGHCKQTFDLVTANSLQNHAILIHFEVRVAADKKTRIVER